jgi:hypothetical protein
LLKEVFGSMLLEPSHVRDTKEWPSIAQLTQRGFQGITNETFISYHKTDLIYIRTLIW